MKDLSASPFTRLPFLLAGCLLVVSGCEALPSSSPGRGTLAEASVHEPILRRYDVEHYAIDITLQPESGSIEGVCRIRLTPTTANLEQIELDLVTLEVTGVRDDEGSSLAFSQHDGLLRVELAAPLDIGEVCEIAVRYGGTPSTGLWFSGTRADGSGPTQVFTHGQTRNSRGWFPCHDQPADRATSEVRVTMPAAWVSLAAGNKIDSKLAAGQKIEHWRMETPHPSYLVTLVAGELYLEESEWDGIPLTFAAEPAYRSMMAATFAETDEILAFLSGYTGIRYPYSKYSQVAVANFPWGGMENISATTLTPLTFDDDKGNLDDQSTGLVAHEAAHQWFGDLFTCRDWSHIWLNEGFATYMALLYFEETRGVDEFRARMRDAQDRYLEEDRGSARRPTVWSVWKDPEDLFDTRSYEGGAARLHLLRYLLGDDDFRAGVRTYVAENTGKSVVSDDLKRSMEKVSGKNLDTFFEQWIYGRGYPEFELRWEWDEDTGIVTLDVWQVQATGDGTPAVFKLPVDIEILDEAGAVTHRVKLLERKHRFEFEVAGRPFYVRFDKYGWIPKTVNWKKKSSEWLAIAYGDDDVNGRRDAARALGVLSMELRRRNDLDRLETYTAELVNMLGRDKSPYVRAAAAEGLGAGGGLEARLRLMSAATEDDSARVRVAALEGLARFGETLELAEFGRNVFDERYSWATMGAAAGLVCAADPDGAFNWLGERLFIDSPHDQLRAYLFTHMGGLRNRTVDDQLRRWALDDSVHPQARGVALKTLADRRRQVVQNSSFISGFLADENFRLRQSAVEALASLRDDTARRSL